LLASGEGVAADPVLVVFGGGDGVVRVETDVLAVGLVALVDPLGGGPHPVRERAQRVDHVLVAVDERHGHDHREQDGLGAPAGAPTGDALLEEDDLRE